MPIWDQAEYESSAGKKMVTAAFTYNSKRTKTYENVEKSSYIFKPTIAYTISLVRITCQLVESVTVRRSLKTLALCLYGQKTVWKRSYVTIIMVRFTCPNFLQTKIQNGESGVFWKENSWCVFGVKTSFQISRAECGVLRYRRIAVSLLYN